MNYAQMKKAEKGFGGLMTRQKRNKAKKAYRAAGRATLGDYKESDNSADTKS